jgi:hypothetical protein
MFFVLSGFVPGALIIARKNPEDVFPGVFRHKHPPEPRPRGVR